ncbi:MAG: hypothetical protein AAB110_01055 [Candidatus Desantisbacteria bacterium]
MPESYDVTLGEIKARIQAERLRVVMAANAGMVLLYWDIGMAILKTRCSSFLTLSQIHGLYHNNVTLSGLEFACFGYFCYNNITPSGF